MIASTVTVLRRTGIALPIFRTTMPICTTWAIVDEQVQEAMVKGTYW